MRKKFGTLLDARLIQELKLAATKMGTSLNELLERALWSYLEVPPSENKGKRFSERTKGILKVSKKDLKAILEEEAYDA